MIELTTTEQQEKTAQFLWTGFIVLFFVIQAIIWTVAITLTASDKSHAVVSGYDQRALNWDEERALKNASEKLGWQANVFVDPAADIRKFHVITLQLQDSESKPVEQATLELNAFHRAEAADKQILSFSEVGKGVYSGKIRIHKSGLWQFEGRFRRDKDVFLVNQQLFVQAGGR